MASEVEVLAKSVRDAAQSITGLVRTLEEATGQSGHDARRAITALETEARAQLRNPGRIYQMRAGGDAIGDAAGKLDRAVEQANAVLSRRQTERSAPREEMTSRPEAVPSSATTASLDPGPAFGGVTSLSGAQAPAWERALLDALAPHPGGTDADAFRLRMVATREILGTVPPDERGRLRRRLSQAAAPGDELAARFQARLAHGTRVELLAALGGEDTAAPAQAAAPLPAAARGRLEATAGRSLDGVRVHEDAAAGELAAAHDARAVTVGQTIHVGAGEDLASPAGERLLAHETAHTLQAGAAGAELAAAAKPLAETAPADAVEVEADRFADAAIAGRPFAVTENLGADVAALDRGGQTDDDLTRERDGENAYMTVRAYDAHGGLVDLWTGAAYFHGPLPVEYAGTKKNGRWRWSRGGEVDPGGAELKVDSDKEGKSGVPVGQWAPDTATQVTVSLHGLTDPFENHIVVDAAGPLTMIGRITDLDADGADPRDLDAPGRLTGPLAPGAIARSGDLLVEQGEHGTTFWLGHSVLRVRAPKALDEYAFTVEPQTSPRQRAIEIVGVAGVEVDLANDADSAQLVYHLQTVPPGQVPAPGGAGVDAVVPEIVVVGDSIRCDFLLDGSRIHVEAVQPGARFAYWIDPEWSGEHGETRAVHIVATPGVRVDELAEPRGSRRLAANPIYVQDPERVPKQGTPIDPADYLGAESLQYGASDQDAATVYTGADSITIRDHDRGVYVAISVVDPGKGGRFAWTLERPDEPSAAPAFRVLVGPGIHVHVHEVTEPGSTRAPQVPYQDFGVTVDLRHTDDPDRIPPQGTELTADLLAGFDVREPDSRSYADPLDAAERHASVVGQFVGDTAIGLIPIVGDVVDLAEVATGIDKWGQELTLDERIALGVVALLPFVGGAFVKVGRGVRGLGRADSELAAFAAKLGKTEAEAEAMLASLRRLDDDARSAARRIDDAVRTGTPVDPADLAHLDRGLREIGFGGLPDTASTGMRMIDDPNAPRVRAPEDVPVEVYDDPHVTGDAPVRSRPDAEPEVSTPRSTGEAASATEVPRSEIPARLAKHRARGAEVRRVEGKDGERYEITYPDGRQLEIAEAKGATSADHVPTPEEAAANRAMADRAAEVQARRDADFTARNRGRGVVVGETLIAGAGQTGTIANASYRGSGRAVPGVEVEDVPGVFNLAPEGSMFSHHGSFPIGQKPKETGAGKYTSAHDQATPADDFVRSVTMTGYESGMVTHKSSAARVDVRPVEGWGEGVPDGARDKAVRISADDGTTFYVDRYVSGTGLGPPRPLGLSNDAELVAAGRLVYAQNSLTIPGARTVVVVGDGTTGAWACEAAIRAGATKVYWVGRPIQGDVAALHAELAALGLPPDVIAPFAKSYNDRNAPTFKYIAEGTIELRAGTGLSAAALAPKTNRVTATVGGDTVEVDGIVAATGQVLKVPEGVDRKTMLFRMVKAEHGGAQRVVALEAIDPIDGRPLGVRVLGAQMGQFRASDYADWFVDRGEHAQFVAAIDRQIRADSVSPDSRGVAGSIHQNYIDVPLAMGEEAR